ncbi:hypothetical protein NQ318_008866 [Aromia moschata]|uniref:Uncharacterized protein n=1 Tax=Aromia moschata TaxID=1265417 RepID=A0AAV8ZAR0_9CUCU|nr:hypothetical protein NQ318_008866 [Aromia moschata]
MALVINQMGTSTHNFLRKHNGTKGVKERRRCDAKEDLKRTGDSGWVEKGYNMLRKTFFVSPRNKTCLQIFREWFEGGISLLKLNRPSAVGPVNFEGLLSNSTT